MPLSARSASMLVLIASGALFIGAWWAFQKSKSDPLNLNYTEARIAGRAYRWPVGKDSAVLPEPIPGNGTNAVMPTAAWASLLRAAMPGTDVRELRFAPPFAIFVQMPQEPVWPIPLHDKRPPVRSVIAPDGQKNDVLHWRQTDSKTPGRIRYFTFVGTDDVYGECKVDSSGAVPLCHGRWNDGGVVHVFGLQPNQVEQLPEIVKWYRHVVSGKPTG